MAGFKVEVERRDRVLVDATDFFLSDSTASRARLRDTQQGSYALDRNRSAIYLPRTKAFPRNTEVEAMLTFADAATGPGTLVSGVTPMPDSVTVREHHSFVALPPPGYTPRRADPRVGVFGVDFFDYASPFTGPIEKQWIARHRLMKKDPTPRSPSRSKPIVYYVDAGAPEPIRSALIEGASWWSQAFEAAGFRNAFQVKVLPPDADPMDVRYNMINWVHRSHARLVVRRRGHRSAHRRDHQGQRRARIAAHPAGRDDRARADPAVRRAARRGAVAARSDDVAVDDGAGAHPPARRARSRAHPRPRSQHGRVELRPRLGDGLSVAVREDHQRQARSLGRVREGHRRVRQVRDPLRVRAVRAGANEDAELEPHRARGAALHQGSRRASGQRRASARRRCGTRRAIRSTCCGTRSKCAASRSSQFGLRNIPVGEPLSSLEEMLVPLYLHHRYQLEAAAKSIGGLDYTYA